MIDDIQIVDNFFSKTYQNQLYNFLLGKNNNWYFQSSISFPPTEKRFKSVYDNDPNIDDTSALAFYLKRLDSNNIAVQYKEIIDDLIISVEKHFATKVQSVLKCRAIYMSPYSKRENSYNCPHIDIEEPHHKTLIYYVNDCDGDTFFFEEKYDKIFDYSKKTLYKTVSPKQGRAVLFDGYRYHAGTNPTSNHRILINLNFT